MPLDLAVGPAAEPAEPAATEKGKVLLDGVAFAELPDQGLDVFEQPPRLRRQLVERAAEQFGRELVGKRDVVQGGPYERNLPAPDLPGLDPPLMLMQQRDRVDKRQIFEIVAPGPGPLGGEGQLVGVGVDHG